MTSTPIDVWNAASFDEALFAKLHGNEALVRDYLTTRQRQFQEQEASGGHILVQENEYGQDFQAFVEDIGRDMNSRIIRAWHYTRLGDDELRLMRSHGLHTSTLDGLRRRLDARVKAGAFSIEIADALYAASPIHHQPTRAGKFYMASEPVPIDDRGVTRLLGNWGGEGTYFWLKDEALEKVVASVGRPRVLEIAVPVASTSHWYHAEKRRDICFRAQPWPKDGSG